MAIRVGDVLPDLGVTTTSNTTGALADPTTVRLTVTLPDGTARVGTWPAAPGDTLTIVRASLGIFACTLTASAAGMHAVRWVASGAGADGASDDVVYVDTATLPPLVSLAEAREQCRVYSTADDAMLQRYVRVASGHCERRTQVWRRQALTAVKDGGSTLVRLRYPVITVATVTEGGTLVDPTTGYTPVLEDGLLYRGGSTSCGLRWAAGRQNVAVTYTAGPADGLVPDEIRQGVLMLTEHLWNTQRGGSGLPRKASDSDWSMPVGFTLPNAVREHWATWIREQVA